MTDLNALLMHTITAPGWKKIGVKPHHGINLSLSSLHSDSSCGIGEFFDLLPLIDWCQRLNIDFIQLLPLNDSEDDPSPYNVVSSCALNFIYLSLHKLPDLETLPELKEKLKEFAVLNESNRIAHQEVLTHKLNWLRAYFAKVGDKLLSRQEAKQFIAGNPWVEPYALFKALQDRFKGISWRHWPQEFCCLSNKNLHTLIEQFSTEVSFYIALQFLACSQLQQIKTYANNKGVFLMGDFPFLISGESADAWQFPEFFDTTLTGGAPPDYYNKEGQNWGFPIYHWDNFKKSNYGWWKQRLKCAQQFYDLIRLDHVVGFFRIWSIPQGKVAKMGHFIPEDKTLWKNQGKELLTLIASSTSMLPIAEDLGTIPDSVRPCLKELGIPATKVMRWERAWKKDKHFIPIHDYPPISITCLGTHDSETLTLWWKNLPDEAKDYARFKHWTYTPQLTHAQRQEILWDSHHTSSLFHVNLLQEYLALFPELIWPNPADERINIPGKFLPTNWTYRFKPSVEELTSQEKLFNKMREILS